MQRVDHQKSFFIPSMVRWWSRKICHRCRKFITRGGGLLSPCNMVVAKKNFVRKVCHFPQYGCYQEKIYHSPPWLGGDQEKVCFAVESWPLKNYPSLWWSPRKFFAPWKVDHRKNSPSPPWCYCHPRKVCHPSADEPAQEKFVISL